MKLKNYVYLIIISIATLLIYKIDSLSEYKYIELLNYIVFVLTILILSYHKKIIKYFKTRIFRPKEITEILNELDIAKVKLDNNAFDIIETGIKKYIFKNKKDLKNHIRNGDSPIVFTYNIINMASSDHFTSGKYPYRNHIGLEYGKGYYLHKLFNDTVDEKVVLGLISKKEAIDIKNEMNQRMSYLINKALPFH